jgi:hypothetical protein
MPLALTLTGLALTIIGVGLAITSLIYARHTNHDRARLEALLQVSLANSVDSVDKARRNTKLAYSHLDSIRRFLHGCPQSNELTTVLDHMTWLHGDVVASHRLLGMLRRDLAMLQGSIFLRRTSDQHREPIGATLDDDPR